MSDTLRQIISMNVWNEEKQQWQDSAPQTVAEAVETADGGNVQTALNAIPGKIGDAIAEVQGGAPEDGNTLGKLYQTLSAIQGLLQSDDDTLDTIQEIVTLSSSMAMILTKSVQIRLTTRIS